MENVTHVEIGLENGQAFIFEADKCSVVLNDIVENVSNLGGRLFKTKVANKVKLILNKELNINDIFDDIAEQSNILEVALFNHLGHVEKYYVKWGEDDIDENSNQSHYISTNDSLVIQIKE